MSYIWNKIGMFKLFSHHKQSLSFGIVFIKPWALLSSKYNDVCIKKSNTYSTNLQSQWI